MKDELLCEGCGCSKKRCDYYPPPAVKCCPDCKHVHESDKARCYTGLAQTFLKGKHGNLQ